MTIAAVCEWCQEAPWKFRCAACDPRAARRLCVECTKRWHAYGFSQEHELEDESGITRVYTKWNDTLANESNTNNVSNINSSNESMRSIASDGGNTQANISLTSTSEQQDLEPSNSLPTTSSSGKETSPATTEGANVIHKEDVIPDLSERIEEIAEEIAVEDEMELEEVLSQYPTEDLNVLDILAELIHQAIAVEDALLCERYNKCKESRCEALLSHHRHGDSVCLNNPTCAAIQRYKTHMKVCKRQRACPFCVRIQQRRALGRRQCLEYMLNNQKRELRTSQRSGKRGSDVIAKEGFLKSQIAVNERKKQLALEEIEQLNRIVVDKKLPIFNFPTYAWHLEEIPFIKNEPEPVDANQVRDKPADPPVNLSTEQIEREVNTSMTPVSLSAPDIPATSHDYVTTLLDTKKNDTAVKEKFETMIQLGFRIVDSQFCSTSKASKCLLRCEEILLHLQHHVDLQVCSNTMCRAVEYHFEHISKCSNPPVCEYCLRVAEREYSRAVEIMEADQLDCEKKIRVLMHDITTSLADDGEHEREQTIIQLEDELQQAEDYKKELIEKLDSARLNVRKVRKRMQRHPSTTSFDTTRPLHFIKQLNLKKIK